MRPFHQVAQNMVQKVAGAVGAELAPRYGWRTGMRHVDSLYEFNVLEDDHGRVGGAHDIETHPGGRQKFIAHVNLVLDAGL